jgi:hypothetical protein
MPKFIKLIQYKDDNNTSPIDNTGEVKTIKLSPENIGGTTVQRDLNGQFKVSTPTEDKGVANKEYVDVTLNKEIKNIKANLGYIIVQTLADRDKLSVAEGTEVYIIDLDVSYRRRNGIWVQISSSGGDVPLATKETAGIVIVGDYLTVDEHGKISVDVADSVNESETRPVSSNGVYEYVDGKIVGPILNKLTDV